MCQPTVTAFRRQRPHFTLSWALRQVHLSWSYFPGKAAGVWRRHQVSTGADLTPCLTRVHRAQRPGKHPVSQEQNWASSCMRGMFGSVYWFILSAHTPKVNEPQCPFLEELTVPQTGKRSWELALSLHPECPHSASSQRRTEEQAGYSLRSAFRGLCLQGCVPGRKRENELNGQTDPLIVLFFDYLLNLLN